MTSMIIVPIILLMFVTPFSISLRGIFNSIRRYSVTNLTLLGFLLTLKLRVKIDKDSMYYSINNKDIKPIRLKDDKKIKTKKIDFRDVINLIDIEKLELHIDYGVGNNAMRTAIEASSIYNFIMILSKHINIHNLKVNVNPNFNTDIIAIDLDIKVRYAILQILLLAIRILNERRNRWKT